MSLQIYEFSRELIDTWQKNGRWVSGGFGYEVGPSNHPVPEKIKDAVNRGDFRINDNYPPKEEQEYALIAREIEEYCILAVANGEIDDKNRPLVVYRYFWLEKPEKDIDGIGVLLTWWSNTGKPKFEFVERENSQEINYSVGELSNYVESNNYEQLNPQMAKILAEVKYYPFPFRANEFREFTYTQLHLLARRLQKRFNISLAWAWNVRRLEHPERFNLIYCVDGIYPYIENNTHLRKNSIKTKPNDKPSVESIPENVQPDDKIHSQVKQCLLNIVNTNHAQHEEYLKQLIHYIEVYSIEQWDWKSLIQEEIREEDSYNVFRYKALLAIFNQIPIQEWLYWLRKKSNKYQYQISFFYLQRQIIVSISTSHDRIKLMNARIVDLLLQCKSNFLKQEQYQEIEWLLIQSDSIWKIYFEYYTRELLKKLIRREPRENDKFYLEILETLKTKEYHQRNKQEYQFLEYTWLGRLFESKGNYALSALFYQLSKGKVPSEIFKRDYVQIIPTTQEEEIDIKNEIRQDARRHRFSIFNFLKSHLEIILLVTLMILGLSGITYILVQENFPQLLEQNSK